MFGMIRVRRPARLLRGCAVAGICALAGLSPHVGAAQPIADFTANPLVGCEIGHNVFFTDNSSNLGASPSWSWDFGDGKGSALRNPVNTYTLEGSFTARLTVTDGTTGLSDTATDTILVDNTHAEVTTFTGLSDPLPGTGASLTLSFSEAVTGLTAGDFDLTNLAVDGISGSGTNYTVAVRPLADGAVSIGLRRGTVEDADSGCVAASSPPAALTATASTATPTIALSTSGGTLGPGQTAPVTFTLSVSSTDFTAGDVQVSGGALNGFSGSGTSYSATFTADGSGAPGVSVGSGVFSDSVGNFNADGADANNSVSFTLDATGPTVAISGAPAEIRGPVSFAVDITFSEAVTGFTLGDINAVNATVTGLTGSGSSYTAQVTAGGTGSVTLQVPAGVAVDAAGNGNLASAVLSTDDRIVVETQEVIADFIAGRTTQLIANQPGTICLMSGACNAGSFDFGAVPGEAYFSFVSRGDGDTWVRVSGSRTTSDDTEGDHVLAAVGAHLDLGPNLRPGLMLQLDHMRTEDGEAETEGTGWLAGPYLIGKLPGQPLYYEARTLWGESRNETTPFGTFTDTFDTDRFLAMVRVAGELGVEAFTLVPSLSAAYAEDEQQPYENAQGTRVPGQSVSTREVAAGLDISVPVDINTQRWTFGTGIAAIHARTDATGAARGVVPPQDGGRARLNLSAETHTLLPGGLSVSGFFDGIGQSGYEAYGASLSYDWRF
ncbi:Ig-like domain-containing protein [Pontivivens ytuae]|uniref:PKD domain-containing protein n=1 Tax=Pontivivens ytuae TaxID=2789856 RepID=A0A7S9LRS5_9RHOB|nr:Ig-like domain-containing protein [Pontivivens ytuae]QPH54106.1 PKD domain-containing protein [Pontivivens ytuae]